MVRWPDATFVLIFGQSVKTASRPCGDSFCACRIFHQPSVAPINIQTEEFSTRTITYGRSLIKGVLLQCTCIVYARYHVEIEI